MVLCGVIMGVLRQAARPGFRAAQRYLVRVAVPHRLGLTMTESAGLAMCCTPLFS